MKKLITISCLLLIVNLSNAQNIYELKIDKKMDKNNRPTIDSGFDILHLEEYKDFLIKDEYSSFKTYEKKTPNGSIILREGNDFLYEKYFLHSGDF